ncbi:helix-turn-helix domain-containing protein [Paenibacillus thalictri]|uniref:AraC family transcriptional regulator n=1 Tax=Paenibacillus thalictri TaxID=2527873 RepID=A0A4Q9DIG9_9BACL|nr:helix-turn-helix domain-containing protein [Paenibacillus thalictri]TBL71081.1 AraC family transcriptional regulator [Paenibacillus thalictri]
MILLKGKAVQNQTITARRGHEYKKILIIVLIITCIPAALIGASFYFLGTRQIETELMQTHRSQLEKDRGRIEEQLAHIELTASQWVLNPQFNEKLKEVDFYKSFLVTQDLYKSLAIIKGSSTLIDQVYLYVDGQSVLISEETGITQLTEERNLGYRKLMQQPRSIFWMKLAVRKADPALSLVHVLPRLNGAGALIITLNESKFNDMVTELTVNKKGASFIVKEDGEWITTGIDEAKSATAQETFFRDEILKRGGDSDTFMLGWNKEDYSVSYDTFFRAGTRWIYVTATPVQQLISPVLLMSRMILIVCGLGIVSALFLSWYGSMRLYSPIHHIVKMLRESNKGRQDGEADELSYIRSQWQQMVDESNYLQIQIEEQLSGLRDGFLLQLVQGHLYALTEKELRDRMNRFGWNVEHKYFSIMVVQLIGISSPQGKFSENDRQLITFAAANIIEELAGAKLDNPAVINFQDLTIGLLITFPEEKDWYPSKSELFKLADQITATLNTLLKLNVTVSIGKSTDLMSDIPDVLRDVRQTLQYRILEENNQVLDMDEFLPGTSSSSYYPFQIEKEIHTALRRGDKEEACRLVESFLKDSREHKLTEFALQQSALYLLGSMLQTTIQMGFSPHELFKGENLFDQLLKKREPDEIHHWFVEKVLHPFFEQYTEAQDSHLKAIVQHALDMIGSSYMYDISLEECADRLGIHPVRLSKGFKHIVGTTFIDFLTKVRIDKSKELLRATDSKITDIAKLVGYHPSYFNKIFRKHEGMTASEYRGLCRGEPS